VDNGLVTLRVIEGRVGQVNFTGNKYHRPVVIDRTIALEPGEPLNLKTLQERINRSNRSNTFLLHAVVSPGAHTGETDIDMQIAERQPWQIAPTFDNQGRPYIGYNRAGVELSNNSLLGFGDRLITKYLAGTGTRSFLGAYALPVGRHGDEISAQYSYSHVNVDLGLPNQPEITGIAHTLGLSYFHPFDEKGVWSGDIGVNSRRVESFFWDMRDNLDEIRSLSVGLNFNQFDRWGRTVGRTQLTTGLGVLSGTAKFFKGEGSLTRLFSLPRHNILMLRAYGQITPDALPSAEAFQIGGAYSVRGYSEGLFIGDRGYSLTVEDRWPIPFLKHLSPWLSERVQGVVFFDMGQIWLDKSNQRYFPGVSSSASRSLLMGTGVGLRARLTQYLEGFVDLGFGLVNRDLLEPNGQHTARVHFGIRSALLPERFRKPLTASTPSGGNQSPQ
jgi:hemolysin activation/secretion protein